jgi:hypothetical protein
MARPLFSFGTSRGGTTFFTRILSVNSGVKMASDPCMPIFREFRNEVVRQKLDAAFDAEKPLDDYYYTEAKQKAFKTIQAADLQFPFPQDRLEELRSRSAGRMSLASKELVPLVNEICGKSFYELFKSCLTIMGKAYEAKGDSWCGSHDNWVIEFLPHLARAFPAARFLVVIRDPRGAMASSMKIRETEPLAVPLMYSFAHHWRKHASFAWRLRDDPMLKGRIFVFRYEDLVSDPRSKVSEICRFLEVAFEPAMLKPENFRPVSGAGWSVYSSFDVPKNTIYTDSIDSWKRHLDRGTVEFIEFVCDPEMRLYGYEPVEYGGGLPSGDVMRFFLSDDRMAKGWRGDHESWDREHSHELFRKQCMRIPKELLSRDVIERYFLFEEVCDACRRIA